LQSFIPNNPIIARLCEYNFKDFVRDMLTERKAFHYPPYNEMAILEYRHPKQDAALSYISKLESKIKSLENAENIDILTSSSSFRKYNSHHVRLLLKGKNIKTFLEPLRDHILREKNLSVIFES